MKLCNTDTVLIGGYPASGKSSISKEYEKLGYLILNRDSLNISMIDLAALHEKHIKDGVKKIVIDATLPNENTRYLFIDNCKYHKHTIGFHLMNTSKEDALINSYIRIKKITGSFHNYTDTIPIIFKNNPNVWVLPAIFKYSKEFKKPKVTDYNELVITEFERIWDTNLKNKALLIDLDGTVRKTVSGEKYPINLNDQYILENTVSILQKYKNRGFLILAVTNQSGVNKGHFIDNVEDIIKETNSLMNNIIDDYKYCPHSIPKEICYCRKPQSGMGIDLIYKYMLDPKQCIMIGDSTSDKTFATRLSMLYYNEKEFFNR